MKAFQRWAHVECVEGFVLVFVVLPDEIVILLVFLV